MGTEGDSDKVVVVLDRATLRKAGRKRWKGLGKKARQDLMKAASRAYWDKLTPEERSAEMRRRAKKRHRKKEET